MNHRFSRILEEINAEIGHAYIGGCIKWVDDHHDMAWTKMIEQFEEELIFAENMNDYSKLDVAGNRFRTGALNWIRVYKAESKSEDVQLSLLDRVQREMT